MDSLCGVPPLRVGDTYVVSGTKDGGKVRLTLCGIAMRWSEVSSRQRKGFRGLYHQSCACQVSGKLLVARDKWVNGGANNNLSRKETGWEAIDISDRHGG